MAAEILSGAFIIFKGRSSSKTSFKALSIGGLYSFKFLIVENKSSLSWLIIWISSKSLINFGFVKNVNTHLDHH